MCSSLCNHFRQSHYLITSLTVLYLNLGCLKRLSPLQCHNPLNWAHHHAGWPFPQVGLALDTPTRQDISNASLTYRRVSANALDSWDGQNMLIWEIRGGFTPFYTQILTETLAGRRTENGEQDCLRLVQLHTAIVLLHSIIFWTAMFFTIILPKLPVNHSWCMLQTCMFNHWLISIWKFKKVHLYVYISFL